MKYLNTEEVKAKAIVILETTSVIFDSFYIHSYEEGDLYDFLGTTFVF